MDPTGRFRRPADTPASSKTSINIGGILVHLVGVQELTPVQAADTTVLFHVHGRTRTYADAENLAHELLYEIRSGTPTKRGLVVAAFDNRNHGTRSIDNVAILDWESGNARHAQDMLSTIDGIVVDLQLVMDHLEAYTIDLFRPTRFMASGVSLGGHVLWNLLAREQRVADAVIVIGSPNLSDLLQERLAAAATNTATATDAASAWPMPVAALYAVRDARLAAISGKNLLILNGQLDTLVPSRFTRPWLEQEGNTTRNKVEFVEQEGVGHWLSWAMVHRIAGWLRPLLDAQ